MPAKPDFAAVFAGRDPRRVCEEHGAGLLEEGGCYAGLPNSPGTGCRKQPLGWHRGQRDSRAIIGVLSFLFRFLVILWLLRVKKIIETGRVSESGCAADTWVVFLAC